MKNGNLFFVMASLVFLIACMLIVLVVRDKNVLYVNILSGVETKSDNFNDSEMYQTQLVPADYIANTTPKEKININTASAEDLGVLSGIGPALAERIIEYRTKNGDFGDIDELMDVKGIGSKMFENIKNYITV